jgi:hypothetical protein
VSDEPTIDLAYIGHSLERLVTEVATLRDDVTVLTAIVHRMDNSQGRILEELRAMHRQHGRLAHRVGKLEQADHS